MLESQNWVSNHYYTCVQHFRNYNFIVHQKNIFYDSTWHEHTHLKELLLFVLSFFLLINKQSILIKVSQRAQSKWKSCLITHLGREGKTYPSRWANLTGNCFFHTKTYTLCEWMGTTTYQYYVQRVHLPQPKSSQKSRHLQENIASHLFTKNAKKC